MTKEVTDWGCPDWRDEFAYPESGDSLTDTEWRWQFMRRHPWYRNAWSKLPKICLYDPDEEVVESDDWRGVWGGGLSDEEAKMTRYIINMPHMRNPSCLHPGPNNQFLLKKGGKELYLPSREYFEDSHTLDRLKGEEKYRHLAKRFEYLLDCLEDEGLLEGSNDGAYVYIRFDTGRPTTPQFESVETILEAMSQVKRSPRLGGKDRENWPIYLRLLDADDQGAKPMEIFNQFEKEENSLVDNASNEASKIIGMIKAARKVQSKGLFSL